MIRFASCRNESLHLPAEVPQSGSGREHEIEELADPVRNALC